MCEAVPFHLKSRQRDFVSPRGSAAGRKEEQLKGSIVIVYAVKVKIHAQNYMSKVFTFDMQGILAGIGVDIILALDGGEGEAAALHAPVTHSDKDTFC